MRRILRLAALFLMCTVVHFTLRVDERTPLRPVAAEPVASTLTPGDSGGLRTANA